MGDGAPAGKYAVADPVADEGRGRRRAEAGPEEEGAAVRRHPTSPRLIPDRLEGRYMNAEKSPFRVEVKPGENNLEPFDVSK